MGDEQQYIPDPDAGRARYGSMRKLVTKYLKSDKSRVRPAWIRTGMDVWPGWIGAVLTLDRKTVCSCSFPKTGRRLLLKEGSAEGPKEHSSFGFKERESPGYFFIITGEVRAHLWISPRLQLYVTLSSARKKLMREAFAIKEVLFSPTFVLVGHGYVQQASSEYRRKDRIQYQSYFVTETHDLLDAVALACRGRVAMGSKKLECLFEEV